MTIRLRIINENTGKRAGKSTLAVIVSRVYGDPSDPLELTTARLKGGKSGIFHVGDEQFLEVREVWDDFDDMSVHTNAEP